jgi:hypothetical protein
MNTGKRPKPPGNPKIITVEDRTASDPERGWRIASGKTNRLVDVHAKFPFPPDATAAIAAASGKKLPCTFRVDDTGKVLAVQEGSYEL